MSHPVTAPPLPTPAPASGQPKTASAPRLVLGGRTIPVVLPNRRDPRLKLSAVIVTLQVLGQTVLDFKVSIAQILVTIGVCVLIDTTMTFKRQGILAWPASALLTGNSIAFILRANGTKHGKLVEPERHRLDYIDLTLRRSRPGRRRAARAC